MVHCLPCLWHDEHCAIWMYLACFMYIRFLCVALCGSFYTCEPSLALTTTCQRLLISNSPKFVIQFLLYLRFTYKNSPPFFSSQNVQYRVYYDGTCDKYEVGYPLYKECIPGKYQMYFECSFGKGELFNV